MREYVCHNCGYRKMEMEMLDYLSVAPYDPNYMVSNMMYYMQPGIHGENIYCCPECRKSY